MASRDLPRHEAATRFLRVPAEDWPKVRQGIKTEFRTRPRDGTLLTRCYVPTPVIAYSMMQYQSPHQLMVLEERRREQLFSLATDPDGLAREGFESYGHFRAYWKERTKRQDYRPTAWVWVWRVRPWADTDVTLMGESLLRELYGEYL